MAVEFGLSLPAGPPKDRISEWVEDLETSLELLGEHFKSIWMTDHFIWGDEPTYEAWTVLSYLAARWPDVKLGPIVLGQSYRNPALLAKMGATLQCLSKGRFIMGIGAGWKEDEYHAYGYPFPSSYIHTEACFCHPNVGLSWPGRELQKPGYFPLERKTESGTVLFGAYMARERL